jgi:quercetin dioxygenase-like cupin family protein
MFAPVLGILSVISVAIAYGQHAGQSAGTSGHTTSSHAAHGPADGGGSITVEFENDSVQVVRVLIGPHGKIPMHDVVSPRVVVLLTDEHLRITLPSGETREEHHKAGETTWMQPQRHAGENLSDAPLEFIAVVPKQK